MLFSLEEAAERGTMPNYRQELDVELKEVRDSELW